MAPLAHFDAEAIRELSRRMADIKREHATASWPGRQLDLLADAGVYRWFVPSEQGGTGWSPRELAAAYLELSAVCLSSTFILTQRIAALRRVAASPNAGLVDRLLPNLLTGSQTATVGISHLTTSRQHVQRPVMQAQSRGDSGWQVDGFCPWVTGANAVSHLVVGAQSEDGAQVLAAIPAKSAGIEVQPGFDLIALTDTHTGVVKFDQVLVSPDHLIAGPVEQVLSSLKSGPSTGSFQTSALALGLAQSAIGFLEEEASGRTDLGSSAASLRARHEQLKSMLLESAAGQPVCSQEELRTEANSMALRATQAAMVAAKGAGFVATHPVGRWCREAMFFLVWSCPQAVRDANLCELAGVE